MPTRREFLKRASGAAAGVVFTGCCTQSVLGATLLRRPSAPQTASGGKRAPVMINGRRVSVIDVHSHVRVPEAWDLVKERIGHEGHYGDMAQANPDNLG